MTEPEENLSPIEEVYDRNVAEQKLKHGTKYEQLTALVFQTLDRNFEITHDVRLRGDGRSTVHQIDVQVVRENEAKRIIIECRDKADPNKINLDEARSFATVVRQLDASGMMITTTDFTAGAKTLADDEGLALMTLRPFLESDMEGRIQEININMRFVMPTPDSVQVKAPSAEGSDFAEGNVEASLESRIVSGDPSATLRDLLGRVLCTRRSMAQFRKAHRRSPEHSTRQLFWTSRASAWRLARFESTITSRLVRRRFA
jgi:hypothetical protein